MANHDLSQFLSVTEIGEAMFILPLLVILYLPYQKAQSTMPYYSHTNEQGTEILGCLNMLKEL